MNGDFFTNHDRTRVWHEFMGRLGAPVDRAQTPQTALFSARFLCSIPDPASSLAMLSPVKEKAMPKKEHGSG